jgi:hypothetical protein
MEESMRYRQEQTHAAATRTVTKEKAPAARGMGIHGTDSKYANKWHIF